MSAKTFEKSNIFDIKSINIEHPTTSHKLSKTIIKAGKVGSNSSLYTDTKKSENVLNEKYVKTTKREHTFKGFAVTYNVEILNSFNPELQLKDTESAIKSKILGLLSELGGFKFVATLVWVFKKIESENKTKYNDFYRSSKAEIIINGWKLHWWCVSINQNTITWKTQKCLGSGSI